MRALARGLEAAALALGLLALGILATGGWTVGRVALTRAEDAVVALALVVGARAALAPLGVPVPAPRVLVAGAAALYLAAMGFIAVTRHLAFRTHALDLGYYVQVVWSIAAGRGPWVTLPPMHAWGDHFSPVLYLLAPLAWIAPVAPALLVVQTAALAAGAVAVFGLARRALDDARPAAALAVLYLVNPTLHGINIRDVHPAAFAIPLLIAAAVAWDAGRHGWCAAALAATLAAREDAAIAVVGFGIWLALARGRWRLGAALAAAAVLVLWVDIRWVLPYFRGEPYQHLHYRWARLGTSLPEILLSLAFRPWRWLGLLLDLRKLVYLAALLAPLGFLPLLAPRALAAALPGLAMNLLAADPVLFHHRTQYQAYVLPFLTLAAVDGYRHLRTREKAAHALLLLAFVASAVLTSRTVNDLTITRWRRGPDERAAATLLARIPARAPVSVNERLVPHLAARAEVYIYPFGLERSEYALERVEALREPPPSGWAPVAREGPWVLLRRARRGRPRVPRRSCARRPGARASTSGSCDRVSGWGRPRPPPPAPLPASSSASSGWWPPSPASSTAAPPSRSISRRTSASTTARPAACCRGTVSLSAGRRPSDRAVPPLSPSGDRRSRRPSARHRTAGPPPDEWRRDCAAPVDRAPRPRRGARRRSARGAGAATGVAPG